jgi:hypothetical protein
MMELYLRNIAGNGLLSTCQSLYSLCWAPWARPFRHITVLLVPCELPQLFSIITEHHTLIHPHFFLSEI